MHSLPEPGVLLGFIASGFFFVVALIPALTAYVRLRAGDFEDVPRAVISSASWTIWLLGPLTVIGTAIFFSWADGPHRDTGGIMSGGMLIFVVSVAAVLGFLALWVAVIIVLGAVARGVKNMPPWLGAVVVFCTLSLAPVVCATGVIGGRNTTQTTP